MCPTPEEFDPLISRRVDGVRGGVKGGLAAASHCRMLALYTKRPSGEAELSVQGDDFTRQIWQMYATFEEFLDTRTNFGQTREALKNPDSTSQIHEVVCRDGISFRACSRPTNRCRKSGMRRGFKGSNLDLPVVPHDMAAASKISVSAPAAPSMELSFETSEKLSHFKDDMSLIYRKPPHHRCRYRKSHRRIEAVNPLLETISAIQDTWESDDHESGDTNTQLYGGRESRLFTLRTCSDVDKDSIGYAGSNSIDSGYKSSCPTPEPSEMNIYGNESVSRRSLIASQPNQKPRIPMGTKVMGRHSQSHYAGRDLDHLMYLRQSILSAMHRYEQQAVASSPSPGFRPRSSSASSPGYRSGSPRGSGAIQRRPLMASCPTSRTHSPCYTSASNGSGISSPGYHRSRLDSRLVTAEEDIDTLLYGRVQEDMHCNYVTMIEDKYRRSSVARIKKLTVTTTLASPSFLVKPFNDVIVSSSASHLPRKSETSVSVRTGQVPSTDYHVYEEIIYDLTTSPRSESGPPPLPARPDGIFRSGSTGNIPPLQLIPPHHHRSGVTSRVLPLQPYPSQQHRPKQRNNIYSLFREASSRRDISLSLEQEFRCPATREHYTPGLSEPEEEYGFRVID
uniref:Uncharacterized protein n=1 Tax=Timema shepardi TaxID=629360 RepID=A0A7R9ANC1_TIMSH|nr:unnamed protein product [Timema shepardi]